jgi:hypothetical protein
MPDPEIEAERSPAPDSSSRQPPWLSRLVTSYDSALIVSRVERSPASV